jgi:hypothetical protein
VLGSLAQRVILGDFFTHDFGQRRFDLVDERTFLCSMSPSRWPSPTNNQELFERNFRLVRSELMTDSLPLFRDMERWQEWLKKTN